jgi:tetratricopeptide (TPR) repeat protein
MKMGSLLCACAVALLVGAMVEAAPEVSAEAKQHYDAGMAAKKAGNLAQAVKEFSAAIPLAPDWPDAHWALAWTYAEQGDNRRAVEEFDHVVRLAPDSERVKEAQTAIERLPEQSRAQAESVASQAVASAEGVDTPGGSALLSKALPVVGIGVLAVCLLVVVRRMRRARQTALRVAQQEAANLRARQALAQKAEEDRRRLEESLRRKREREESVSSGAPAVSRRSSAGRGASIEEDIAAYVLLQLVNELGRAPTYAELSRALEKRVGKLRRPSSGSPGATRSELR